MSRTETQQCTAWAFDATAALAEAETWRGTPHKNRMAKKGSGIDCVHLLRELLIAGGACDTFTLPFYDQAQGLGAGNNIMERLCLECLHGQTIDREEMPPDGAIVIFQAGKQSNHCAMILGGRVWHAVAMQRVRADEWSAWGPRAQAVIVLTGPGFQRHPETLTAEDLRA